MKKRTKKEILIVDDDLDVLNFIQKILDNAGYLVIHATNKKDGIECIAKHTPHMVILDYNLDGDSGLEMLKHLKQSPHYHSIPILMISGYNKKSLVQTLMSHGATDFLQKPLSNNALLQKCKKMIKDHELPTYKFKEEVTINAHFEGQLVKINELSCFLRSSIKFPENVRVKLESKYLNTLGAGNCPLKVLRESKIIDAATYLTELAFKGMDESTAQRIRKIKVTGKNN